MSNRGACALLSAARGDVDGCLREDGRLVSLAHRDEGVLAPLEPRGARDRVQAVVLAYEAGIVTPGLS